MNTYTSLISRYLTLFFGASMSFHIAKAQLLQKKEKYSLQDTLRGSNGSGRSNWNVIHYDITVQPDYQSKTIQGFNLIQFYDEGTTLMQIDMQEPMMIDSVIYKKRALTYTREGNVYWTILRDSNGLHNFKKEASAITVYFHGKPREAIRPPWDGGWIWKKDKMGNPWMSVACQGLGASVWYPCKDYQGDEPDSGATLRMIVPDSLMAVGNGRMIDKRTGKNGFTQYSWEVKNPINNYNIIPYIGKYSHFEEIYPGEKGPLDLNYWVLDYNLEKAKKQFTDVPKMMKAFEYWFGPYPFYEDGYKLIEAPHLGMEHQSAVAYGNSFKNGYMGRDRSGSGWGLKWDFIIIHESGHEWFANNITTKDIADMWVHEGFTNYSETLFTDYYYGKEAGNEYAVGERVNIANDIPIIGPYGVNKEGSGDMYDKAGNMLHTIRQVLNNDEKFRQILRGLNQRFYHQTLTTAQIEQFMSKESGLDLSRVFDQYLRNTAIPTLEYKTEGKHIWYRWTNCVADFDLPVKYSINDNAEKWISPITDWKKMASQKKSANPVLKVNKNFYVNCKNVSAKLPSEK